MNSLTNSGNIALKQFQLANRISSCAGAKFWLFVSCETRASSSGFQVEAQLKIRVKVRAKIMISNIQFYRIEFCA